MYIIHIKSFICFLYNLVYHIKFLQAQSLANFGILFSE